MPGRNSGICHSCRAKDHYFDDCKKKRPCTLCKCGFEKCFVVEKESKNKGRLFICCSNKCGFWDWVVNEESSGLNKCGSTSLMNPVKNETIEDMSRMFESRVRISEDEELHISVNVTVRTEKLYAQVDAKGKRGRGAPYFDDCKKKRPCTLCKCGFEKCFVVEKESKNKGRLFICCSNKCGFWDWVVNEESSGPNKCGSTSLMNPVKNETIEDMSRMFESRVRISEDEELHISVNVTVRTEKLYAQVDAKGKQAVCED